MHRSVEHLEPRRLFAAGDPDLAFGRGGWTFNDFDTRTEGVLGATLLPDGKFVAFGAYSDETTDGLDYAIIRYGADGALDTTWGGGDGRVEGNMGRKGGTEFALAAAALPGGKVLALIEDRRVEELLPSILTFIRLNADGSLDTTFGEGGGRVAEGIGTAPSAMLVAPDGKIYFGLGTRLFRYNADGTLDTTFGNFGSKDDVFESPSAHVEQIVTGLNGTIYVAATQAVDPMHHGHAIARLTGAGALDTTFGTGGRVVTAAPAGLNTNTISGLTVLPDGRLILGGIAGEGPDGGSFFAMRYSPAGTLDASYGDSGAAVPDLGLTLHGALAAANADGEMTFASIGEQPVLARLTNDGDLDASFGAVTVAFDANVFARGAALRPDGRIVLALDAHGAAPNTGGTAVAQFLVGGSDPSPVRLQAGTLALTGSASADRMRVTGDGESITALVNGIGRVVNADDVQRISADAAAGDDVIILTTAHPALVSGGDGDDRIAGAGGNDTIFGNAGNDRIDGDTGHDLIHGNGGNDRLAGGFGNDRVLGDAGADRLAGESGDDILDGGVGDDFLDGALGADRLMGSDGNDTFVSDSDQAAIDDLYGGGGNDTLLFGDEEDLLTSIETI